MYLGDYIYYIIQLYYGNILSSHYKDPLKWDPVFRPWKLIFAKVGD